MPEPEKTEMVTTQEGEKPTETPVTPDTLDSAKAELDKVRQALQAANREAAERRKKLEAFEKAEADRKQAEMTELEKLQAELKETKKQLAQRELDDKKRVIAQEVGLPDLLATRIQGKDDEEMKADALKLFEALPKPAKPNPGATNPGAGGAPKETDAEKRKRLFG